MAHNLLLVDESPLIHRVVELTMEGLDISVYSAEDTEEALTLARSLKPHFILASTTFKRNSGFDLCRTLKDDAELGNIPILLLSSATDNVTEEEALDAGAIGFLTKPFEPESLLAHVEKVMASAPPKDTAPEPEAAGEVAGEDDAFADFEDEPAIEDTLTADLEDTLTAGDEVAAEADTEQSAGGEDDALSDLIADADEDVPPFDELDETIEEAAIEAPPLAEAEEDEEDEEASAGTEALTEEEAPAADMDINEFLDELGADAEESTPGEISAADPTPSSEEEASSGDEEFDPMQLALEHTLADDFEALAEEEPDSEETPEAAPSPEEGEIDQTLQEVEDSLTAELKSLAEESASIESDSGLDELAIDDSDDSALEAAEAELGSLQAELAADFEAPDGVDEGGLEHLADDQVQAAEDELASLQNELAAEDGDDAGGASEYGTSSSEAENFLEEMVFRESGALEESPGEVEAPQEAETVDSEFESALEEVAAEVADKETEEAAEVAVEEVIQEPDPTEDDAFWEQLEIEADEHHEPPPASPEIYSIPHEDELVVEDEPVAEDEPVIEEPLPEIIEEATPLEELPAPSEDSEREFSGANVQKSLERTVEIIVPALLRRIEDMVVAQLPDMVEKIVIREIDKIKRGE